MRQTSDAQLRYYAARLLDGTYISSWQLKAGECVALFPQIKAMSPSARASIGVIIAPIGDTPLFDKGMAYPRYNAITLSKEDSDRLRVYHTALREYNTGSVAGEC